jgi:hypothetical protein
VLDAVLEEADGAEHVDVRVEVGLAHGAAYVHLARLVAERLWFEIFEYPFAPAPYVRLVEARPAGDVLALAAREVVHHGHLVPAFEETVRYVRAYEAGAHR